MKLTGKAIRDRISLGEKFNVVIVDKDTDCSINMGFGFVPNSVFVEELDESGVVMSDDIISIKEAIKKVKAHKDENFYETKIEEIEINDEETLVETWA